MQIVDKIIFGLKDNVDGNKQKSRELFQLGKFIYCLKDDSIEIVDVDCESPDFILKANNKLVGLELIDIKDEKINKPKTTEDLLEKAKQKFQELYPDIKIFASFSFKNKELTFNKKNKDRIINEICIAAYNCYIGKFDYPDFISDIKINNYKHLDFSYLWVGYVRDLDSTIVYDKIQKKEAKIESYKLNSGIDEQWLLMVIQHGAPNSFDFENINELEYSSKFDRVYLLEEIAIELKQLV
jgi:hypothetical protein